LPLVLFAHRFPCDGRSCSCVPTGARFFERARQRTTPPHDKRYPRSGRKFCTPVVPSKPSLPSSRKAALIVHVGTAVNAPRIPSRSGILPAAFDVRVGQAAPRIRIVWPLIRRDGVAGSRRFCEENPRRGCRIRSMRGRRPLRVYTSDFETAILLWYRLCAPVQRPPRAAGLGH